MPIVCKKLSPLLSSENAGEDGNRLRSCILSYLLGPPRAPIVPDLKLSGFLKTLAYEHTGKPAETLTNSEKVRLIGTIWHHKIKAIRSKEIAFKMGVALDPELHAKMAALNIRVDDVLFNIVGGTFLRLQEKFYPGQQLGLLMSVRHDKRVPEARILIFPKSYEGNPLHFSGPVEFILPGGPGIQIDLAIFIQNTLLEICLDFEKKMSGHYRMLPSANEDDTRHNRSSLLTSAQEMLLTEIAFEMGRAEIKRENPLVVPTPNIVWPRAVSCRKRLKLLAHEELRPLLDQAYSKWLSRWDKLTVEEAVRGASRVALGQLQIRSEIRDIATSKSPDHASTQKARAGRRSILRQAFQAEATELGWSKIKRGGGVFWDDSEGGWWNQRMLQNDDLGLTLREISLEISRAEQMQYLKRMVPFKRLNNQGKFEALQRRHLKMTKLLDIRSKEGRAAWQGIKSEKITRADKLELQRECFQYLKLFRLEAKGRLSGRLPDYLELYSKWKQAKRLVPVALLGTPQRMERQLSYAILKERDWAALRSAQVTEKDLTVIRAQAPPIAVEEVLSAANPVPPTERIQRVRMVSAQTAPDLILDSNLSVMDDALSNHREAVQLLLKHPFNDQINRGIVSPWLDPDDQSSFSAIVI